MRKRLVIRLAGGGNCPNSLYLVGAGVICTIFLIEALGSFAAHKAMLGFETQSLRTKTRSADVVAKCLGLHSHCALSIHKMRYLNMD